MNTHTLREWLEQYPTIEAQLVRQGEVIREEALANKISSGVLRP